ncbi:hypothetical protein [uncultured Treponema sp.]|uniref:hypothetical protein n=1 Tax=uncultured Treponema sp. TaxID=162155 RepID=UPI0025F1D2CB|nr:hypothetical protein [uncultured Treponema sp.]
MFMSEEEIFDRLFSGGKYSLPYLVKFYHPTAGSIRLVNNNEAVELDGELYAPSSFEYTRPDRSGKGGSLKITGIDNGLIEFVENANWRYRLDVAGVIAEDGTVQRIRSYVHFYGSVSYGDDMQLQFQLGRDDRFDMLFCPYFYDTDNNPANA